MATARQQQRRTVTIGGGEATLVNKYLPSSVDIDAEKAEFSTSDWGELSSTRGGSDHDKPSSSTASSKDQQTDYYFSSYAHFGIHEEMLRDTIRTGAYQRAILDNGHLFKDKIVLDVGCGTGVLAMFAVQAGCKHVYGIECSEIVHTARILIDQNKFSNKITLIQAKAEETTLPVDKVDIIISEWMGYFLLYESMLDTVLYCRDKWLKPNGLIFPDRATLHLAGIEDGEYKKEKFEFWDNAYGLDFSPVKKYILEEPTLDLVQATAVVTDTCCVLDLDLNKCTVQDTNFAAPFRLKLKRRDYVHALIGWFDCEFSACHNNIIFSTGPASHGTHWKQCVFYLSEPVVAMRNEEIKGWLAVRKNAKNHRDLDIKIKYGFKGQCQTIEDRVQYHRLR